MKGSASLFGSSPRLLAIGTALAVALGVIGCGRSGPPASPSAGGKIHVVAAENFWGSIAMQLAGGKASVQSIIVNPNADPHTYEPSAQDARAMVGANMAIVNGIGYDSWASQLLHASPQPGRVVLNVGEVLGLPSGANQHRWYYPSDVYTIVDHITSGYQKLDPADAAFFAVQKQTFETQALARYNALRQEIRGRYAGVPVGYSESIFQGLGEDLGLRLLTPYSFVKAIAEGTDVTAQDKQAVDAQAREGRIKVWIFNSQNVTPDVQRVNQIASERHIPVARVTETLTPATDSFQQWQVSELEGLIRALHAATSK
jgi:zinc/manganese transport system substrate-binding protein